MKKRKRHADLFTRALLSMVVPQPKPVLFPWDASFPDAINLAVIRTHQTGPCLLRRVQNGLR